ncbi:MAG: hypothetical protein WD024_01835, partial [Bacillota bacterium]
PRQAAACGQVPRGDDAAPTAGGLHGPTRCETAGEREKGVSSSFVSDAIKAHGHTSVLLVEDKDDAAREAAVSSRPGDVVVTMGAGDVWKTHGVIRDTLERA